MIKMVDKSNYGSYKPKKSSVFVWTNTEMNDLVLVLVRRKKQYTVRLEPLASKESSNNQVFEEISKDFENLLSSDEFKEDNERENSKPKGKQKNNPLDISPARLRINAERVTRHTDSSSQSPFRFYTRRMILLQYKSGHTLHSGRT